MSGFGYRVNINILMSLWNSFIKRVTIIGGGTFMFSLLTLVIPIGSKEAIQLRQIQNTKCPIVTSF